MNSNVVLIFFFFKQKTAYEMRISDWSSDVCSSDLLRSSSEPIREFRLHGDGDRLAEHVLKAHGVGQRSIVDALDNPRNDAAQLRADDAVVEAAGARVKHRDDALAGEESRGVEAVGKEGAPGRFQKKIGRAHV